MHEKFTDRARKVMQLANNEAQRFNHEYIGTEHILLGLVKEGSGVAANVLKNLDLDLRKIRREVERIVQPGPDDVTMGKVPQTPRAKKVVEYAMEEARHLKHNYVGTEHLLLGLLREGEGVASQVLMNLGVGLEAVRREVLSLLGVEADPNEIGLERSWEPQPRQREDPELAELPQPIKDTLRALDTQLAELAEAKVAAVKEQDFEKAARLRDEEDALKKQREDTLQVWRGKKVTRAWEYEIYLSPRDAGALGHVRQALREQFGGFLEFAQRVEGSWQLGGVALTGEVTVLRVYSGDAAEALLFFTKLKEDVRGEGEPPLILSRHVEVL